MTYYGQWNPPQDEVIYRNYFLDNRELISVECGASTSGTSTHFFDESLNWACFNLEASKYAFKCLKDYRPHAINLNIALSNKNGVAVFKDIISAPGGGNDNGSLHHIPAHMKELEGYGCVFEEYEVPTMTYATFIDTFFPGPKLPILFVLDVEGFELEVIEGMKSISKDKLPFVICVEYPIVGLDNLIKALGELEYDFDFVSYNNAYFSQNRWKCKPESWFGATERMPDIK
jgi:FkbM family methyltransferase